MAATALNSMVGRGIFIKHSAILNQRSRHAYRCRRKRLTGQVCAADRGALVLTLFLERRQVTFRRQLVGLPGAQLAQELFFRFKRPTRELTLVTMITNSIRTAMTAVAVDDSGVSLGDTDKLEVNPNRDNKQHSHAMAIRHAR